MPCDLEVRKDFTEKSACSCLAVDLIYYSQGRLIWSNVFFVSKLPYFQGENNGAFQKYSARH